jgi:hypothetical protein
MLEILSKSQGCLAREDLIWLPNHDMGPRAIVAIPVRDEETRIAGCLKALLDQRDSSGRAFGRKGFGIVLLLNNCHDRTMDSSLRVLNGARIPFLVINVALSEPLSNAGFARGLAMETAAQWLERANRSDGVLLTTDADSRVRADWVARNIAAIDAGCSAAAGHIVFDPVEENLLPERLIRRNLEERAYEQALLALSALIDPIEHDPWPNHRTSSGASFAITLQAYRKIGGLPRVSTGEDRALSQALLQHDIPIRHDPGIVVATSARLDGRARGGAADTLRLRCQDPTMLGDAALEPFPNAIRRYFWRRRLRGWHNDGAFPENGSWAAGLDLPFDYLRWAAEPRFGRLWSAIEAASPLLSLKPLPPDQLRTHTSMADALLGKIRICKLRGTTRYRGDISAFVHGAAPERMAPAIQ